jgi:hypothetical protein
MLSAMSAAPRTTRMAMAAASAPATKGASTRAAPKKHIAKARGSRDLGTFDQLMVSPLRTHEILIGKTAPPLMIGPVHATVYVLAALFVFEVPLRGSLLLLYPSLIVYLAAVIGVGLRSCLPPPRSCCPASRPRSRTCPRGFSR